MPYLGIRKDAAEYAGASGRTEYQVAHPLLYPIGGDLARKKRLDSMV